jgi:hypothetical protein
MTRCNAAGPRSTCGPRPAQPRQRARPFVFSPFKCSAMLVEWIKHVSGQAVGRVSVRPGCVPRRRSGKARPDFTFSPIRSLSSPGWRARMGGPSGTIDAGTTTPARRSRRWKAGAGARSTTPSTSIASSRASSAPGRPASPGRTPSRCGPATAAGAGSSPAPCRATTPGHDDAGNVVQWFGTNTDITELREADERQRLLVGELNHRVKNTLAAVQSIAAQTARGAGSLKLFQEKFDARLLALSRSHNLLARETWRGADLGDVVSETWRLMRPGRSRRGWSRADPGSGSHQVPR